MEKVFLPEGSVALTQVEFEEAYAFGIEVR